MVSVGSRSTISIIFVGLLSMNYCPKISAFPYSGYASQLSEHFYDAKTSFDMVHILAQLKLEDQEFICSQFTDNDVNVSPKMVDLVDLDLRPFDDSTTLNLKQPSPIPIFKCKIIGDRNFFITYTTKNTFFQLHESTHESNQSSDRIFDRTKVMVEATTYLKLHPMLMNINSSVERDVVLHFQSENYSKKATEIFNILDDEALHLCKIFPIEAENPLATESNYEYETSTERLIIYEKQIGSVPCVICHPAGKGNKTLSFNVFHYYDNIFFKTMYNDGHNNYEMVSYS